jgi:hypothetical protein
MSYIDSDRVVLNENEVLNQLLICLICTGILIDPKECSKCQRAYCEDCLKKLKPNRCSVCKNLTFANAHIQTKYYLDALKFKTVCCDTIINYSENKTHIQNCEQTVLCKDCNIKYIKEEDHTCIVNDNDLTNPGQVALARTNTVAHDGIDTNREVFIHGILPTSRCYICRERDIKYQCFLCEKNVCEKCAPISAVFKWEKIKRFAKEQFSDYMSGYKCSTFFVIYSCYEEGSSDCSYSAVIVIYIFLGLAFDIFMAALIGMIYVIVIPMVYLVFFTVFIMLYILAYVPFTYFNWIICLNRKRTCIRC